MTLPRFSFSTEPASSSDADVIVVAARKAGSGVELVSELSLPALADGLTALGVSGGRDELVRIPNPSGNGVIAIVGLGGTKDAAALRYAAGSAVRQLAGVASLAFALPTESAAEAEALLEGAVLGAYSFTEYKGATAASLKTPVSVITVHVSTDPGEAALARVAATAEAMTLVKDLVNMPPVDLYPASFADIALEVSAELPVDVTVWDETQLKEDGFGGILGVGQGSSRPPRLVKVSYSPAGAEKHLALVGKGITFDTGGISLKPAASMLGMKYDMTGAATVLAVTLAAARLELPVRITAWLCLAENMPSGTATRPDDVLRIRGGRTVEVTNTDAEGRLVLADGLVAAGEENPDAIVDVATLTGAQIVALGKRYVGTLGDDDLVARVIGHARDADETLWHMPLAEDLRPSLKSDVADMVNAKVGSPAGGMLLAALFLQEFIPKQGEGDDAARIPWAHLDIAGPSHNDGAAWGFTAPGPTGVTVRTLLRLAEDFSRA